jgi:phage-related baseplate assembly protein
MLRLILSELQSNPFMKILLVTTYENLLKRQTQPKSADSTLIMTAMLTSDQDRHDMEGMNLEN